MIEEAFPQTTELMDKCLYQEAAPTMEDAIRQYLENGPDVVNKVIAELDELMASEISAGELMAYVERHSDYVENDSAIDTFKLIKKVLEEGIAD